MNSYLGFRNRRVHQKGLALATLIGIGLFCLGTVSAGQPDKGYLNLGDPRKSPDNLMELPLNLIDAPEGLTGLQFDLVSTDRELQLTGRLHPRLQQRGKSLYVRQLQPGVFRFLITGLNQSEITQRILGVVTVGRADISPGVLEGLSLRRVVGTDSRGRRLPIVGTARKGQDRPGGQDNPDRARHP